MKIKDFGMSVAEDIRLILGSEYSIEYTEIGKNNGVIYHAILITKTGEKISPTIYIDGFYEAFADGAVKESIVRDIIRLYRENMPKEEFDTGFYGDFGKVCSHLSFKVINYEKNKKELMGIPYKRMEDLAMVPICMISDDVLGDGNITVRNEHIKLWEISFEELWENVIDNSVKIAPVKRRSLFEVVGKMMGEDAGHYIDLPGNMLVITNIHDIYGAAAAFYPGYLENLSDEFESDLVVLPSSVHETIIMPAPSNKNGLEELLTIVREVNGSVLREEDFLSNNIYLYNRQDKKLKAMQS